jgi:hypothetical protein
MEVRSNAAARHHIESGSLESNPAEDHVAIVD